MSASRVRRLWHLIQSFERRSWAIQTKSFQTSSRHCLSSEQDATPQILKPTTAPPTTKAKKISKAMQAYIDRAKQHDDLIQLETAEYEMGKRHLANIMGVDPHTFDQEGIDKAIEYLLPSGLFDKKAKPVMKHPSEIFPSRKAAQFGMDGRPFHYLFYTGKPQFYQIMHETSILLEELNRHEDVMIAKGFREAPAHEQWSGKGSEWISAKTLESRLVEPVNEKEHFQFVTLLDRVLHHGYSNRAQGHLMQFRQEMLTQDSTQSIAEPVEAENGRRYMESDGKKKRTTATVQVWDRGSGRVTINGQHDILYFDAVQDREQVMFPLQLAGKLSDMDLVITVDEGGPSTQSGAIRLALARALCSFVDAVTVEKFRLDYRDPWAWERTDSLLLVEIRLDEFACHGGSFYALSIVSSIAYYQLFPSPEIIPHLSKEQVETIFISLAYFRKTFDSKKGRSMARKGPERSLLGRRDEMRVMPSFHAEVELCDDAKVTVQSRN